MRVSSLIAALALSGCLPTEPPEGVLSCESATDCPTGWSCSDARCWRDARDGAVLDGGPRDGGPRDGAPSDGGGDSEVVRPDGSVGVDSGVDASTDAGPSCPTGRECVVAAPIGWNGPILLLSADATAPAPPSCPVEAPATAFSARSGLSAPPASCSCDCVPPSVATMSCGPSTLSSVANCFAATGGTTLTTFAQNECKAVNLPTGTLQASTPVFSTTATSCAPMPGTSITPATWSEVHRGCGFGAITSCGDAQVCAPERTADQRLCVYVDGDATCPDSYPDRILTGENVNDTRGCSACSCGTLNGRCTGFISFANGCGGETAIEYQSMPLPGCGPMAATPRGSTIRGIGGFAPSASCPPSAVNATGTAALTSPRTVCCAPD